MLWTLWDLFTVWNLLSLGWLLLSGGAVALGFVVFLAWQLVTAPKRALERASAQAALDRKNAAWRAEMERLYRPTKP